MVSALRGALPPPAAERLRLALAAALAARARASGAQVGTALVYHRVAERQETRDDHLVAALGARLFEAQMRHLRRHYRPVRASRLREATLARRRGEPVPVAVTFDDDLSSHLEHAIPILERVGVPATFFVTGARLSGPTAFWWERLQAAFDRDVAPEDELARALGLPATSARGEPSAVRRIAASVQALPPERRREVSAKLLELLGGEEPAGAGLAAAQLAEIQARGFELGFHTRDHDELPGLDEARLERALRHGRDELERAAGGRLETISYPHGRADSRVADAARAAGYVAGFTGVPGPLDAATDPLLIGRQYPSYGSAGRFALALARSVTRREPR